MHVVDFALFPVPDDKPEAKSNEVFFVTYVYKI